MREVEENYEQVNLFVNACSFYDLELINKENKDTFHKLIPGTLSKLTQDKLVPQGVGFLKMFFVTNSTLSEELALSLTSYLN